MTGTSASSGGRSKGDRSPGELLLRLNNFGRGLLIDRLCECCRSPPDEGAGRVDSRVGDSIGCCCCCPFCLFGEGGPTQTSGGILGCVFCLSPEVDGGCEEPADVEFEGLNRDDGQGGIGEVMTLSVLAQFVT